MEPFNITVGGEILTIHPLNDETFQVYQGNTFVAELTPHVDENAGTVWTSADLISKEYLVQIGEAIELHER